MEEVGGTSNANHNGKDDEREPMTLTQRERGPCISHEFKAKDARKHRGTPDSTMKCG